MFVSNEFLEIFLGVDLDSIGIQVIVDIIVTQFGRKDAVVNARDLLRRKGHDLRVGQLAPVGHKVMKVATSGTEDQHIVLALSGKLLDMNVR